MTTLSNISVDSPFIPHIPTPDVGFTSPAPDAAEAARAWCRVTGGLGEEVVWVERWKRCVVGIYIEMER